MMSSESDTAQSTSHLLCLSLASFPWVLTAHILTPDLLFCSVSATTTDLLALFLTLLIIMTCVLDSLLRTLQDPVTV